MTIRLRPHHLLCLLTFVGEGYSPSFITNMQDIVRRLESGEPVDVVDGPDDICRPMLGTKACHCHEASVTARDHHALDEIGRLLGFDSSASTIGPFDQERLRTLRSAFAAGAIRSACRDCPWDAFCSGVAAAGFAATRLGSRAMFLG